MKEGPFREKTQFMLSFEWAVQTSAFPQEERCHVCRVAVPQITESLCRKTLWETSLPITRMGNVEPKNLEMKIFILPFEL